MRTPTTVLTMAALVASCGGNLGTLPPVGPTPVGPPRWSMPEKIDPTGTRDRDPLLSVAPGGEAVAVWHHESVGGRGFTFPDGIRARRFVAGTGWAPTLPIPGTKDLGASSVAVDDSGLAVVVGRVSVDGRPRTWASRSTAASGWSGPEAVQEGGGDSYRARVVMPLPGTALSAWSEFDGTRTTLWSRPLDAHGWRRTQPIELTGDRINSLDLVADGRGRALATWYEGTRPGGGAIFANLFEAAHGWRGAQLIASAGALPVAGFDASGRALAVWNTSDGIKTSRFLPGSGWTAEADGPGGGRSTYDVHLAVSPAGQGLAAWQQQNSTAAWELWAALYEPLTGWGAPRLLSRSDASEAQVVMDAAGRGVVVWDESDFVLAQAYLPAAGWGRQERLGPGSRAIAAGDARGNVIIAWAGSGAIWFTRAALAN
jgi:hypothetical protein